jgi:ABC-2 type transport system ATP-binding protein
VDHILLLMANTGNVVASATCLRKRFGEVDALAGFALELRKGEILGLIGPSGSGKTSFARALVGLLTPDSGEVRVFGERMPSRKVLGRVGYMAQADALYDDIDGLANLAYFAALQGMGKREARQRAGSLVEFVGLSGHEKRFVREYSGGMRKRLSLAVALIHEPELIVLDEPTVGVDPRLRLRFWDEFRRLSSGGAAILATTHVMDEAERCDRLALVFEGRVIAQGSPEGIRSAYGVKNLEEVFLASASGGAGGRVSA